MDNKNSQAWPKMYIIDGKLYYCAETYERELSILMDMIGTANALPYVALGLSLVSLVISIAGLAL